MSNKEFEKAITLKPKEYEDFIKYQKMVKIEEKRKELRKIENRQRSLNNKANSLTTQSHDLKQEIKLLLKESK